MTPIYDQNYSATSFAIVIAEYKISHRGFLLPSYNLSSIDTITRIPNSQHHLTYLLYLISYLVPCQHTATPFSPFALQHVQRRQESPLVSHVSGSTERPNPYDILDTFFDRRWRRTKLFANGLGGFPGGLCGFSGHLTSFLSSRFSISLPDSRSNRSSGHELSAVVDC